MAEQVCICLPDGDGFCVRENCGCACHEPQQPSAELKSNNPACHLADIPGHDCTIDPCEIEDRPQQASAEPRDKWSDYLHALTLSYPQNPTAIAVAKEVRSMHVAQLRSYTQEGFLGDVNDPVYMEAMRLENLGFEAAHQLRACGHSRGDYRDIVYGTDNYSGNERCVACDELAALKQSLGDCVEALKELIDYERPLSVSENEGRRWDNAAAARLTED